MVNSKDSKPSGKEPAKPAKSAPQPPLHAAPMHPRDLPGKGSKNFKQAKGRSFRHQGR